MYFHSIILKRAVLHTGHQTLLLELVILCTVVLACNCPSLKFANVSQIAML